MAPQNGTWLCVSRVTNYAPATLCCCIAAPPTLVAVAKARRQGGGVLWHRRHCCCSALSLCNAFIVRHGRLLGALQDCCMSFQKVARQPGKWGLSRGREQSAQCKSDDTQHKGRRHNSYFTGKPKRHQLFFILSAAPCWPPNNNGLQQYLSRYLNDPCMLSGIMPSHALCYLITSRAGDLIAQSDPALCADSVDATSLCRLLAYYIEATGARNVCSLDLSTFSLIVRPSKTIIVAASIPPGSQAAQAHFRVHLLAVLFQLGALQFGNVQLGSLQLQHSGSNPSKQPEQATQATQASKVWHLDLQQFMSYRHSAEKGLSVVLQFPGVCFAELMGIDVCDKCFQIHSLTADDYVVHSHKHAYTYFSRPFISLVQVCTMWRYLIR